MLVCDFIDDDSINLSEIVTLVISLALKLT